MAVIAHYKLNDNATSSTVLDATGVHNGKYYAGAAEQNTSTGSSAGVGSVGTSLDFDGADEHVEIADHADFSPILTPFSISAWVYMHEATNFIIATKGVILTDLEWQFVTGAGDTLFFQMYDDSNDKYIGRRNDVALSQNTWTHFVGTYDGGAANSSIKLYKNGVQFDTHDSGAAGFVKVENLTHAVWIGNYNDATFADGLIDNVIFFNHELNEDEAKALYHGGHGTEIVAVIDDDRRIRRR